MSKPVALTYGRCQIHALVDSFNDLPGLADAYEWVRTNPETTESEPALSPDTLRRCEIFFLQIPMTREEPGFVNALPARCRVIRVPFVYCPVLWPQRCVDKREYDHAKYTVPPFFGDRVMDELMARGGNEDEILDRYFSADLAARFKVERVMAYWERAMKEIDSRCDIPVAPFILRHFQTRRLFTCEYHCTGELLLALAIPMLEMAWGGGLPWPQVEFATLGRLVFNDVPVHPSLARALKLEWYRGDLPYRLDQQGYFLMRDYMRKYIRHEC
jgi:hypothetical protein